MISPRVSLVGPTVQKRAPGTFAIFECRFFSKDSLIFFYYSAFRRLSERDCFWDHHFSCSPEDVLNVGLGTTKVGSSRSEWCGPAVAMAVHECECLARCFGDTGDQHPVRSPQTFPNWFVVLGLVLVFLSFVHAA